MGTAVQRRGRRTTNGCRGVHAPVYPLRNLTMAFRVSNGLRTIVPSIHGRANQWSYSAGQRAYALQYAHMHMYI